jgi:hypothetical protein
MSKDTKRDKWVTDAMVHLAKCNGSSDIENFRKWAESLAQSYYDNAENWGKLTAEEAVDEDLSYL